MEWPKIRWLLGVTIVLFISDFGEWWDDIDKRIFQHFYAAAELMLLFNPETWMLLMKCAKTVDFLRFAVNVGKSVSSRLSLGTRYWHLKPEQAQAKVIGMS